MTKAKEITIYCHPNHPCHSGCSLITLKSRNSIVRQENPPHEMESVAFREAEALVSSVLHDYSSEPGLHNHHFPNLWAYDQWRRRVDFTDRDVSWYIRLLSANGSVDTLVCTGGTPFPAVLSPLGNCGQYDAECPRRRGSREA